MKTITIQIGNSDDKLTQKEWHNYVDDIQKIIDEYLFDNLIEIHFSGGSPNNMPWQNYCWVFACKKDLSSQLKEKLSSIRIRYQQVSIAITEGDTNFV